MPSTRNGPYPEQVERWRQAAQDANEKPVLTLKEQNYLEKFLAQVQPEIKARKQELQRCRISRSRASGVVCRLVRNRCLALHGLPSRPWLIS